MQITELYELTAWVNAEIVKAEIVEKYQSLLNILNNNARSSVKQSFEDEKEELLKALNNVALVQLTADQMKVLEKIGIATAVGSKGISTLEDVLFRNALDVATAAAKVQEALQGVDTGVAWAKQVQVSLEEIIDTKSPEFANEVLLRINFSGHAAMSNISDLKSWSSIWYEIGRGVAMAHNRSPEDVRVVGAAKGSIIIELAVAYAIAKSVSKIILEALTVADRVLDIRKKAEEIRSLKLNNDKLASDLEKEADTEKEKGIKQIADDLVKALKLKAGNDGDKVAALEKAIKNLVNFTEKGGSVDFVLPKADTNQDDKSDDAIKHEKEIKELRNAFESIRLLEHKLKQIEHKPS